MHIHDLIALPLPSSFYSLFERISYGVPSALWRDPTSLHLTLKYLGEISHADEIDVKQILGTLDYPPFTLTIQGFTLLKSDSHTSLAVQISPSQELNRLRSLILTELKEKNITKEKESFTPHISLADIPPGPNQRLHEYLFDMQSYSFPQWAVDQVGFYQTYRTEKHIIYDLIETFYLKKE